jgi:hypothetical protein
MRVLFVLLLLPVMAVAAEPRSWSRIVEPWQHPGQVVETVKSAPCAACGAGCKCQPNCGCDYEAAKQRAQLATLPPAYPVPAQYRPMPARREVAPVHPYSESPSTRTTYAGSVVGTSTSLPVQAQPWAPFGTYAPPAIRGFATTPGNCAGGT